MTFDDKLMYILNQDKQNYLFCRFKWSISLNTAGTQSNQDFIKVLKVIEKRIMFIKL